MNVLSSTTTGTTVITDTTTSITDNAVLTNCWQPTYTGITYTFNNNEPNPDITIRKLEKGYIVKFQGKEYAFEKLESIYKNIDRFYSKEKDTK